MRLNGVGGPGGGGQADLKTNDSGKAAAANALSTRIQPAAGTAGVTADESSDSAVTAFKGWATATGLKDALEEWGLQVKSLQGRLANDKNALLGAKQNFLLNDLDTGGRLRGLGGPQLPGLHGTGLHAPPVYDAPVPSTPPVHGPFAPGTE
ncbi:hypothetical protein [Streptomyces sp. SM11]|uniref:hypothetical protein n=1 Tax=Streptomyces sp. SM11 TaxID=565557 RepID=UPI000CD4D2F3|nr:hypothetical protein [Streptomyces sp. SM11]